MEEYKLNLTPNTRYQVERLPKNVCPKKLPDGRSKIREEIWIPGGYGQPTKASAEIQLRRAIGVDMHDGYIVEEGGYFEEEKAWHIWWRRARYDRD